MIGNDIVDLETAQAESNWRRKGFIEKIFTEEEKEVIFEADDQEKIVWLFWSMKEAAYKAHQRKFRTGRKLNPQEFSCQIHSLNIKLASGNVLHQEFRYATNTVIKEDLYIHSTACFSAEEHIIDNVLPASSNLKQVLISVVSGVKKISINNLKIEKDELFIPHIYCNGKVIDTPFSLSHHGKFSAYILALTNY